MNLNTFKKSFDFSNLDKSCLEVLDNAVLQKRKIGIAFSGGADSLFLLLILYLKYGTENILALHFNHKLRANSEKEEVFVKDFCKKLNIECIVGSVKKAITKKSEEAFREERLKFFKHIAKAKNINVLAQGHHSGDVAETILMRLMRASSLDGLCAPRKISHHEELIFVRPLLTLTKEEILSNLKKSKISWCEDESNQTTDFLRNKIRHKIIPILDALTDRSFSKGAMRSRELLEEDALFLENFAKKIFKKSFVNNSLHLKKYTFHFSILRRLLNLFIAETKISLSAKCVQEIIEKISSRKNFKVGLKNSSLIYDSKTLILKFSNEISEKSFAKTKLHFGENILPNGDKIILEKFLADEKFLKNIKKLSDNSTKVFIRHTSPLYVRCRLEGDAYQYIGLKGKKLLQDIFTDKKIDKLQRNAIPIVCNNKDEILWVRHLPPASFCALKDASDAISLTYIKLS